MTSLSPNRVKWRTPAIRYDLRGLPHRRPVRFNGGVTAIVGLVDSDSVYIGGDSAGVSGMSLTVRADAKVFRRSRYLFGFTTSFRMGQLIRYSMKLPTPTRDLDGFMATTFVDALRDCLKAGGWALKDNEREEGGTFLVGVRGQLFAVYDDYQVAKAADGFAAVGCGDQVALGALYATARTGLSPRRRVLSALAAAERFSAGVRGPFLCLKSRAR
jgi:ATP-dependent protease HslVU (ClpYQ) peptidase subunit